MATALGGAADPVGNDHQPAAVQQEGSHISQTGEVEGRTSGCMSTRRRCRADCRRAAGEQARHLEVGDLDPLRAAGRARGEEHVRQLVRAAAGGRRRGRPPPGLPMRPSARPGNLSGQALRGHHHAGSGQRQQAGQPLGRRLRIERQIGAVRLENAEDADHQLAGRLDAQADAGLRPDAGAAQRVGEAVGPRVELRPGELRAGAGHRHGVRRAGRLDLEAAVQEG